MPGTIENSVADSLWSNYNTGRAGGASSLGASQFAQWSALMDAATCDWCGWADERIFDTKTEPYSAPTHFGCRCIVAYIQFNEELPSPTWGKGPPKSSFPPGSRGGYKEGKPTIRRGPPKKNPFALLPEKTKKIVNDAVDRWEKKVGSKFRSMNKAQIRGKVKAAELRPWQNRAILELNGNDHASLNWYTDFMKNWTGSNPRQLKKIAELLTRGSSDDLLSYMEGLRKKPPNFLFKGLIEVRTKEQAEALFRTWEAQKQISQEVMRRSGLLGTDDTVTLYRGVKGEYANSVKLLLKNDDLEQVIGSGFTESWTTDIGVAKTFATNDGIVFTKEVPVDDVLTSWWSDGAFTRYRESEVVWMNHDTTLVPKAYNSALKEVIVW